MKPCIEELDAGLKEIIETRGRSSKAKIIRSLFDRITEAMSEGITLDMLIDYLNQNDVNLTKNTLRNILYRIRKERGIDSPQVNKQTQTQTQTQTTKDIIQDEKQNNNNVSNVDKLDEDNLPVSGKTHSLEECINYVNTLQGKEKIDNMLLIEHTFSSFQDRYQLYGGDPCKLEGKGISSQRNMLSTIKLRIFGDIRRAQEFDKNR